MGLSPALLSSERQDWQTPDEVLDVVRRVGPIGLDPCTVRENPTGARLWAPLGVLDGLSFPWHAVIAPGEIVYINPPYGRECGAWVEKACAEGAAGAPLVLLVANRLGSAWGQRLLGSGARLCFWRGRIRFRGAPNAAPFGSLFAGWNCDDAFRAAFGPKGELR